MFGLLNLNKPAGVTSRDVVNRVQRLLPRKTKVGHAGTLDPLATGVLIVCVGPATRLVPFIHELPKSYRAEFQLGCRSDTDDITGQVEPVAGAMPVPRDQVEAALGEFRGSILQTPPQHSAIQVGGQRAYDLARAGQTVELAAREVNVHRLDVLSFDWPLLTVDIDCSSGTYIRSIARDLGERLGVGGLMTKLQRTSIGPFAVEAAIDPASLTNDNLATHLLDPLLALPRYQRVELTPQDAASVQQGRAITISPLTPSDREQSIAACSQGGKLLAMGEQRGDPPRFYPMIVFSKSDP